MSPRARGGGVHLLDINVLVALFHPDHVHHDAAQDWFAGHVHEGWATCPLTENGFLRVALALAAPDARFRPAVLIDYLRKFCASRGHQFWDETLSLRDPAVFDLSFVAGPRQLTDVYLLGLAKTMGGRLATFDQTIPLKAVVKATPALVSVIGGRRLTALS